MEEADNRKGYDWDDYQPKKQRTLNHQVQNRADYKHEPQIHIDTSYDLLHVGWLYSNRVTVQ